MDGLIVGREDDSVGLCIGNYVVGLIVGIAVGLVGAVDGLIVGRADDGFSVGLCVGNNVVGLPVGVAVVLEGAMDDTAVRMVIGVVVEVGGQAHDGLLVSSRSCRSE